MNEEPGIPIDRPLRWQWDCKNTIVIYQPDESVHGGHVFLTIHEDPDTGSWAYDSREQMERTAEYVVRLVNEAMRGGTT